jgi:hypothetical protein
MFRHLSLSGGHVFLIVRFITEPIGILQYINNGKGVKTMEGVIRREGRRIIVNRPRLTDYLNLETG